MADTADRFAALKAAIRRERQRLSGLDAERRAVQERIERLQEELETAELGEAQTRMAPEAGAGDEHTLSPAAKVELFRSLFRGRSDVFPVKFLSRKTGKTGYAPECANKFVPGICGLPKIKCGECRNQAFRPADDRAVLDHLQGRHIMGIYPLLDDDTCWFLAVDFDKSCWQQDVAAFRETCRAKGVPCAIERSQSGNGAHAWFFFATHLSAGLARQMGSHLLTQTMERRHQLSMDSYDRLFPSQDTLPRGGFGNLIALPLQYLARRRGNTLFLDDALAPYADQWAYLATLPRLSAGQVRELAAEAAGRQGGLGIRSSEWLDDDDASGHLPWQRPPSGSPVPTQITGPLPVRVEAVLAQRLFVATSDLSSRLVNAIKRLAAFQNPEFYKKQRMRLSTALTPRVIARAEDDGEYLALPRGCLADLEELLTRHGIAFGWRDERCSGGPVSLAFQGELTPSQREAGQALLASDAGILVAPPGFGKTVLGAYLASQRRCSTLVLVHRQPLVDQWVAQLALFLGISEKEVGRIGGGKRRPNGVLDVATFQSLVRKDSVDDLVAQYGQVIVDECHHVPAASFERVLGEVRARFVVGLTATPRRRDGHDPILTMQIGPIRHQVSARAETAERPFRHRLFVHVTTFRLPEHRTDIGIQELYGVLAQDAARNERILDDVISTVEAGRSPLVLTERKDHLAFLAERLEGFVRHLVVFRGGLGVRQRRALRERLETIPANEERLVLATGRYVGEGFDDRRLDTLFLTLPVAWKGTVTQYAGRLHRLSGGKREVQIHDYVDVEIPTLRRMFEKRLRAYRAMGYATAGSEHEAAEDQPMLCAGGETMYGSN